MLSSLWVLLAVAGGLQEGESAQMPQARFDALVQAWRGVPAIEYEVHSLRVGGDPEDGAIVLRRREGSSVRWALPLAGHATQFTEDGQVQYEALGEGQRMFAKMPDAGYTPMGEDAGLLSAMFPACSLTPFRVWLGETPEPVRVEDVAEDERFPLLEGLKLVYADRTEVLWLDPKGSLVAASVTAQGPGEGLAEMHFQFASLTLHAEADEAEYAAEVPADAIEEDPFARVEASLLAVGETIPDLTLMGMDGKALQVADLRGKTLLFNFWFYH